MSFPAANYLQDSARTTAEMKQALEDFLAATKQIPGAASGTAEPSYTISAGSITPTVGIFSIDTEGAAASDDLANIVVTNIPEPGMILIRCANNGRNVVLKHAAGGSGQLSLRKGVDFTLDVVTSWVLLKRTGTTWEEVLRSYGNAAENDGAEVDVASAATCNIGTAGSNNVRITGTTTITSFGTADAGILIFGRFAAALTLTHNGTSLLLPGGANIPTAANDRFIAQSLGSGNWIVIAYQPASGSPVIGFTGGTLTSTLTMSGAAINEAAEVDIASAATCNIGAAASNNVRITGTTTITAFDSVAAGIKRDIRFAAALTLTHNATSLILPNNGSNITTEAGDAMVAESLGSGNWKVLDYTRASGLPLGVGTSGAKVPKLDGSNQYSGQQGFAEGTLTDAATISWPLATKQVAKVTLGGNRTLDDPTDKVAGSYYGLTVIQDGTGSRTLAFHANYKGVTGYTPTATAGAKDELTFRSDGTYMNLVGLRQNVGA